MDQFSRLWRDTCGRGRGRRRCPPDDIDESIYSVLVRTNYTVSIER